MEKRETFGSRLGFILVSAGCAIGLGNVWKFPYICGQNGGGAFVLVYLLCLAFISAPILIAEFAVGRASGHSVAKALNVLEPEGTSWHKYRWFAVGGNYLLMMFYTMVSGWMVNYAVKMGTGSLSGMDPDQIAADFSEMLTNPGEMTLYAVIVIVLAFGICSLGLQNGVERISKVLMIMLLVLLVALAVHTLTLPNMSEGLSFYLKPDFSKMSELGFGNVLFAAMSHSFFTLSVGIGAMTIFGSYLKKDRSLAGESVNVVILDTFVAITAGIVIIPACFAYGVEPDSGPSLLFITLPNVFNHMTGGRIWGFMFFIFMSFAAASTVIAVFENIIKMTMEIFDWTRKKAVLINLVIITVLSMPAILGFNVLSFIQPLGEGTGIMDLEDFLVSYNLLPLGALLFILFVTRKNGWGWDKFLEEVNTGEGLKYPATKGIKFYASYILPLIIIAIYLKGYYDMFSDQGTKTLIIWMCVAAALLALIFYFATATHKKTD